ncbi:MAG: sulfite exporter TauE/SafE family protein [Lachnospiraceae bacterium]|nr:sulfite exporter TauE/SafE family protein [Lachnospiraceae bacterium]
MIYLIILFLSNVVGSIGGFGAGMISIPFLTQLFEPKMIIMASTLTCILNLWIAIRCWGEIEFRKLWEIIGHMCLGLPVGIYAMKMMDVVVLKHALGIFMIFMSVYGFLKLKLPCMQKLFFSKTMLATLLFLGGVVQGAISSGGSFVVMYAQQELGGKRQFRGTLALLWTAVSVIAAIQYAVLGTLRWEAVRMAAIGAPAVLAGIIVGGRLCGKLSQRVFLYVIYVLLFVGGVFNLSPAV